MHLTLRTMHCFALNRHLSPLRIVTCSSMLISYFFPISICPAAFRKVAPLSHATKHRRAHREQWVLATMASRPPSSRIFSWRVQYSTSLGKNSRHQRPAPASRHWFRLPVDWIQRHPTFLRCWSSYGRDRLIHMGIWYACVLQLPYGNRWKRRIGECHECDCKKLP